jgi:putative transposase
MTYPHPLVTRLGSLTLKVPRLRNGDFSTDLFHRFQRSEQAFILALMEMVVNGVSTRKVKHITYELCGETFSKSTISELCKGLDPTINAWNNRSLSEREYSFLIVDALVIKVREDQRARSRSTLLAVGVK